MGTGSLSRRYSAVEVAFTTNPYLAPRLKKDCTYTFPHPLGLQGLVYGELYVTLRANTAALQDNSCFAEETVSPAVV